MSLGHHASATITVILMSLLVFPAASRLGQRGVDQWLSNEEREKLRTIDWPWWVATAIVAGLISWHSISPPSGDTAAIGLSWLGQHLFTGTFVGLLFALTRIDLASRLLPDQLTASLVLCGLVFHWLFDTGLLLAGIQGAALGYGLLWLLARLFEWLRGQEAMGRGDFFMAAGLGAWLGWQALPMVLMLASLSALLGAIALRLVRRTREQAANPMDEPRFLKQEIPFGPALAFGGLATWALHYG